MFLIYRVLIILFVFLLGGLGVQAQEIVAPADSLAQADSLLVAPTDSTTLAEDSIPKKQTGLDVRVFEDALTFKIALMVADHMKFIENRK